MNRSSILYLVAMVASIIGTAAVFWITKGGTPPEPVPGWTAQPTPSSRPYFAAARPDSKPLVVAEAPADPCKAVQEHLRSVGCDPVSPRGPWLDLCELSRHRGGILELECLARAHTAQEINWCGARCAGQ